MKNLPKINPAKAVKASLPYVFAGLLCTKLGEAYRLTTGGDVLDKLLAAFTKLGLVFQNPLPSFHPFDLLVGAVAAVLLRLVVWSKIKNAKKYRHGEEYGTARWGNEKDIAPFINSDFSQNILLTDTERLTLGKIADPEKRNVNLNVLVIGGSGSGKTRYHKEHFSITVAGQTYTERKAAGQAIIDACTKMTDVAERVPLGEYRGFPMTLWADTATQKFQVTMKHSLSHTIELGSDPVGNIARLENALAAIADHLEQNRGKLENLNAQMEEAKLEVKRPFPQEQELAEKTSRLNVLRIALNMDGKSTGKRERDKEELDGGKPSIKGMLKRLGVESAATASTPQKGKDMEVAI